MYNLKIKYEMDSLFCSCLLLEAHAVAVRRDPLGSSTEHVHIIKSDSIKKRLTYIKNSKFQFEISMIKHIGLKLDGAIGQGKSVTPLKVKIFQNPSCPILEKIK